MSSDPSSIVIDNRLIEIDLGAYDGRFEDEIAKEIGLAEYERWRNTNFQVAAPGGESLSDAMQRVRPLLQELTQQINSKHIGLVAHQGILMAIKAEISGRYNCPDSLNEYKQRNDEVDVWDLSERQKVYSLRI